ncbi:flagellar hook capping FlgD N-terminal domain-containing protein [Cohnella herbarum]|uniref:Flagellar hook assembly protein FlgD n=1 Tax=Cohnella herbarum TaxID=2728023 RepID=A0A7Z2ZKN6_9BACL|nr:flagellar hook capping FlgD N-terminal domain-containing protein [Cohnella herbarum]QJD83376.1 flagellar hook assembly protein FlgD [Cohnella herbarum]
MADSIGTKNIWPYYSSQNVQAAARKPVKEMGKDQFLQILVTQLRNQDPMQPMQDKEFIAQMAQFSSLEQMMNMSKEVTALRQSAGMVAGLIGKEISWFEETEAGVVQHSGTVSSVLWSEGVQYAKVENVNVPIDEIISISEPTEDGGPEVAENE